MFHWLVVIPLVIIYSKLVDAFPRQRVFYALSVIYALIALGLALCMLHGHYGIYTSYYPQLGHPHFLGRLVGWASYVFVESFGSIMVALFWAFAADTTTPDSAKRAMHLLPLVLNSGGIFGPLLLLPKQKNWGS